VTATVLPAPHADEGWPHALARHYRGPLVIEAKGLGVQFSGNRRGWLRSAAGAALGRAAPSPIWALRGLDLTVAAGECLGIIGPNGAGKTTLLRAIAGLISHDGGTLMVHGRISALLNLGVGFDPLLSGRENVRLVGSLMGLRRHEIRARTDAVIDFADIGDSIDRPLRTYSSGMRARLGFAAAAGMIEPDVLLLDEVMGTGDAAFRERSRERVMDLVEHAHTVVVASHDMAWIAEFATYAVLLEGGAILAEGAPSGVTTLHRARAVVPPRAYGCEVCQGQSYGSHCPRCGVWRRDGASVQTA
jgi:ABC-type polysaccharide/polyol phosphate transport system ATPase subunit